MCSNQAVRCPHMASFVLFSFWKFEMNECEVRLITKVSILDKSDYYLAGSAPLAITALSTVDFWQPHLWRKCSGVDLFSKTHSTADAAKMAGLFSSKQLFLLAHLHNSHQEAKRPWKWMIMFQPGACHHAPFIVGGGGKAINYSINQKLCWLNRGCKVHNIMLFTFCLV